MGIKGDWAVLPCTLGIAPRTITPGHGGGSRLLCYTAAFHRDAAARSCTWRLLLHTSGSGSVFGHQW